VFITISTLFRPVEQLLSRTIAERQASEQPIGQPLRVAATIQLGLAAAFAACALAFREPLEDELLSGNETLYWILVAAALAFSASFFARGFLAGTRRFALYALLLLAESTARVSFAVAVAIGVASGQTAVALGIVAAPLLSLMVVPLAFASGAVARSRAEDPAPAKPAAPSGQPEFTLAAGGGFAAAVLLIMVSEQALLNAGPLVVKATEGAAAAGFIFNVLMIARAPLVLFQAVATSLLPHLTRLRSSADPGDAEAFELSVRLTVGAICAFAAAVALIVLIAGPELMQLAFGENFDYDRIGLLIVTAGMGFYLASVTLNQAALAQGQVRRAAACWVGCALAFICWNLLPVLDEFRRVEVGFTGAAALLCGLLFLLYRRPRARPEDVVQPGSPQEIEARLAAADEAS
jgi:O-antigen/teichoic acid export membrane protein